MSYLPLIEGRLKQRLLEATLEHDPNEACGIIYQEIVFPLRNHATTPQHNFEVKLGELRALINNAGIPLASVQEHVFLWHSHPGGGIGPSTFDLTHKTPLSHHLVVSLVKGDLVPTWY